MSVLNQSGEEQVECPLCMEPLEVDDLHFYPCTCGYQICRFCWNRIREGENGLCPACRKAYPENPADFTPLSQEQVAAIKTEKKAREQKRRNKTLESRRALANVRVVQNNLVFVVGLPVRLADPEILKRQEYFGKYGKIHKVVINQSTAYAGSQGPSASAYVTYVSGADALRAIQGVNNVALDGRVLKGSLGTTKYCANFMKNQPCPKPDCMYLHELGDPKASFTKEEMHAGLHQVYERKLHHQLLHSTRPDDKHYNGSGNSSTNAEKSSSKDGNQSNFIPTTVVTSSHINVVNSNKSNKKDSSSGSASSSTSGKEAWPSLGSSPPSDSPARKQSSPKPQSTVKSQENGTSESSSPTQLQAPQTTAQTKGNKDTHTDSKPNRNKDTSTTNGQSNSKKSKSDKSKQKSSNNSINNDNSEAETEQKPVQYSNNNVNNSQTHSVFETEHTQSYLTSELDELESDRHSLLETHDLLDTSDHSLLEDDDAHHLLGDGRDTRQLASLRGLSGLASPYLPAPTALPRESNHLLGANYHTNPNMLPPFGMRAENGLSAMPSGFLMHNQQQMHQANLVNGFDSPHTTSEGRYLSENMDKFFTDFNKAQQMRQMNHGNERYPHNDPMHFPHNMLSAERLEMEHKQRMNNVRASEGVGRAAGDADDDLDFDPFKETQKAFAELMENEMLQNGDNMERVRRSRLPPPGFSHVSGFGLQPRPHQHQGYVAHSADWSQLDPAIVSVGGKQQEVWARVQQLQQLQLQREGWQRLPWAPFVPLPPGFAPNKPPQHPAECIDAK